MLKKYEESYGSCKKIVTTCKTQTVYTMNGCNTIASNNFAHVCRFLVPCYTIMIPIENFKLDYQNVSHKKYTN